MAKRKSFNPLKMWGSYIGVSLLTLSYYIYLLKLSGTSCFETKPCEFIFSKISFTLQNLSFPSYTIIFFTIAGFLLGWGIHSIFRGLRR